MSACSPLQPNCFHLRAHFLSMMSCPVRVFWGFFLTPQSCQNVIGEGKYAQNPAGLDIICISPDYISVLLVRLMILNSIIFLKRGEKNYTITACIPGVLQALLLLRCVGGSNECSLFFLLSSSFLVFPNSIDPRPSLRSVTLLNLNI